MDKRAFLVLGPESSGTRLMMRLLVAAGVEGDFGHDQRWEGSLPNEEPLVAIRRSVPHRRQWPDIAGLVDDLRARLYDVMVIVTSRDWHSMIISQQAAPHAESVDEALAHIRRAYCDIFAALASRDVPYEMVNYEALTQRPAKMLAYLFQRLGLPVPESVPYIYDGNARYYRETLPVAVESGEVEMVKREIQETWGVDVTDEYAGALIQFVDERENAVTMTITDDNGNVIHKSSRPANLRPITGRDE